MKLEFCRRIFEKYWDVNFNENPSSGSPAVPCGRTGERKKERHNKANSHFSHFGNVHKIRRISSPGSTKLRKLDIRFGEEAHDTNLECSRHIHLTLFFVPPQWQENTLSSSSSSSGPGAYAPDAPQPCRLIVLPSYYSSVLDVPTFRPTV